MPTYDYLCEKCDHRFEQFQSISSSPLRKCPKCSKTGLKRLIGTGAGIIFKGSGFYQTDYRTDSYTQAAKKEKDSGTESTKTETKSETSSTDSTKKSENKSESKTESKPKEKKKTA